MLTAKELARKREAAHLDGVGTTICSHDYEEIGCAGEIAFAREFGLVVDESVRPKGDAGIDFWTKIGSIDVKTARKAEHLLVPLRSLKKLSDILVLARYSPDGSVTFLGWDYSKNVEKWPVKSFFDTLPIPSHYMHWKNLRSISELKEMFKTEDDEEVGMFDCVEG